MKTLNWISAQKKTVLLAGSLLVSGLSAVAASPQSPISVCQQAKATLAKLQTTKGSAVREANQILANYETPANLTTRLEDLRCLIPMAAEAIAQDPEGTADEYFFDLSQDAPREFQTILNELPSSQRKSLELSLAHERNLWHGQH